MAGVAWRMAREQYDNSREDNHMRPAGRGQRIDWNSRPRSDLMFQNMSAREALRLQRQAANVRGVWSVMIVVMVWMALLHHTFRFATITLLHSYATILPMELRYLDWAARGYMSRIFMMRDLVNFPDELGNEIHFRNQHDPDFSSGRKSRSMRVFSVPLSRGMNATRVFVPSGHAEPAHKHLPSLLLPVQLQHLKSAAHSYPKTAKASRQTEEKDKDELDPREEEGRKEALPLDDPSMWQEARGRSWQHIAKHQAVLKEHMRDNPREYSQRVRSHAAEAEVRG